MATRGPAGPAGSGGAYDPRYDPAFQRGFDGGGRDGGGRPSRLPPRSAGGPGSELGEQSDGVNPDPRARQGPGPGPAPGESSWSVGTGSVTAEVDSAPGVSGAASPVGSPGATGAGPAGSAGSAGDPAAEEHAAAARAHAHRMWTAYTVGLSALSAACMAFGVVLVTRAYGVFNSTTVDSRDDIYWAQLGGQFGPWVFVVGLATGIGVIFLHAARWRPPRE